MSTCQQLAFGERPSDAWVAWAETKTGTVWQCGRPARLVERQAPAGRGLVAAAYCPEHGGRERAQRLVEASWLLRAPASVGDQSDVERAGARTLGSEHHYIVIRPTHAGQGEGWLTWLGLGSHMEAVAGAPAKRSKGGQIVMRRQGGRLVARGTHRFGSREAALAAARAAWAERVEADVEQIRIARGGTLNWGLDVAPPAAPIELELPASGLAAWDAAPGPMSTAEAGRLGGLAGRGVPRPGNERNLARHGLGQALSVVSRHAGALQAAIVRARAMGTSDEQVERAMARKDP